MACAPPQMLEGGVGAHELNLLEELHVLAVPGKVGLRGTARFCRPTHRWALANAPAWGVGGHVPRGHVKEPWDHIAGDELSPQLLKQSA